MKARTAAWITATEKDAIAECQKLGITATTFDELQPAPVRYGDGTEKLYTRPLVPSKVVQWFMENRRPCMANRYLNPAFYRLHCWSAMFWKLSEAVDLCEATDEQLDRVSCRQDKDAAATDNGSLARFERLRADDRRDDSGDDDEARESDASDTEDDDPEARQARAAAKPKREHTVPVHAHAARLFSVHAAWMCGKAPPGSAGAPAQVPAVAGDLRGDVPFGEPVPLEVMRVRSPNRLVHVCMASTRRGSIVALSANANRTIQDCYLSRVCPCRAVAGATRQDGRFRPRRGHGMPKTEHHWFVGAMHVCMVRPQASSCLSLQNGNLHCGGLALVYRFML